MDVTIKLMLLFCVVGQSWCREHVLQYSLSEGPDSQNFMRDVRVDSGVDSTVVPFPQYSFEEGQQWQELFLLGKDTGILTTKGLIDRELVCPELEQCSINLEIIVQSDNSNSYYELIQVTVLIIDINDNSPYFKSAEYEEEIMENANVGAKVPLPKAIDLDSPNNGVKGYRLLSPVSQFTLEAEGSSTSDIYPVLVLQTELDREVMDLIELDLVAFDSTNTTYANTAQIKVSIIVQDVNDNPPEFRQPEYALTLDEDQDTMATLVKVEATDPDLDDNGALVYSFDEETANKYSSLFSIDSQTGDIVLVDHLDYEDTDRIELTVLATEKNPSNMPAQTRVAITVRDINDNKPVITLFSNSPESSDFISIKENQQSGAFLARLKVTDQDSGPNGEVTCVMETLVQDVFLLQLLSSNNYKFITNKSLDRELQTNYTVVFLCRDGSVNSPLETRLTKLVVIEDENDNTPVLTKANFSFTLHENNPVGAQLLQLQASDPDSGANGEVRYALLSTPTQYIDIHPHTGSITTLVAFDYELDPLLTFLVAAFDQGEPSMTATAIIEINVLDTNDEPPVFASNHYRFTVYENLKLGAEVGQVAASDPDSPPYSEHYFTFVSGGKYNNLFAIEPSSGNLYTRTSFDRELKDLYDLQIKAYDKLDPLLFSIVNATVTVEDQNDHTPIIEFPKEGNNTVYIGPVPNDIDQPLLQILATDADIGQNALLDFLLEPEHSAVFIVNQSTGHLYVKDTDKLYSRAEYTLNIQVQDNGDSPLFTMTQVLVQVETDPEVLATNTVIIIVVGVISGVVVSSLVISIALILFKRKAKYDKEKQLGSTGGKHYTVKPVEGDIAEDNVSELSATVLNNSQQGGNTETQGDRSLEIRTPQNPTYNPMGYDISEVKDKLSETSNSDSGLGSYEESQRVVHRLSPTDHLHLKGVVMSSTEAFPSPYTCRPSPTDSAYSTDVMIQKPYHKEPEQQTFYPNQQQQFIQTRHEEVGVHYPKGTRNQPGVLKNYNIEGNSNAITHASLGHQVVPESILKVGHHNPRSMSSDCNKEHSRKTTPVRQIHPRNTSPNRQLQHMKRTNETESASAASTPSKRLGKSTTAVSQRSNSTGPFDRHRNNNAKPSSPTQVKHQSSQYSAHKHRKSIDVAQDPQLSPMKLQLFRGMYPEQYSNNQFPVSGGNINNVAGHEIGIIYQNEESITNSPDKSHRPKQESTKKAGNSHGGKKNVERASSAGVDYRRDFNSPTVSAAYINNTPESAQHENRYPRDSATSTVVATQNNQDIQNSCEPGPNSSLLSATPASADVGFINYKEGTGEESVV